MRNSLKYDLAKATWYKSSYSGPSANDCLEVSDTHPDITPVRDSKNPTGPKLVFHTAAWSTFVEDLKRA